MLSLMILSSILAIALGGSSLLLREIQFERTRALYVRAFFAAESGIEKILTLRGDPLSFAGCTTPPTACLLSNGAEYWVIVTCGESNSFPGCAFPGSEIKPDGTICTSPNYCIESIGRYQGTRRAIEVNY